MGEALHEQFEAALTAVSSMNMARRFFRRISRQTMEVSGSHRMTGDRRIAPVLFKAASCTFRSKGSCSAIFRGRLAVGRLVMPTSCGHLRVGWMIRMSRGVALRCDTPGGEAAECFEAAERIFAARTVKPIRAFAKAAYSAGYALTEFGFVDSSFPSTGGVGSIRML